MLISISGAIQVLGDVSACLLAELIACAGHDLGNTLFSYCVIQQHLSSGAARLMPAASVIKWSTSNSLVQPNRIDAPVLSMITCTTWFAALAASNNAMAYS